MGKGDDAWLESLDEFKQLKSYEKQKERAHHELVKSERTVRGDWKPRQKGRGDWICPRHECGNINFGYRDECNLCSEPRPKSTFFNIKGRFVRPSDTGGEIGAEASDKSGGLFNADDWICRCGNINWAKRNACHECGRSRVELAPRLGARMADSEGKAIKNELLTRAGDSEIIPSHTHEDEPPREMPDIARVGAGRFAKTNPSEVYGEGSMAGMERLNPMIGDSTINARYNNMMSRSRGSIDHGFSMPGFHKNAPGLRKSRKSYDDDEDFGALAKREVEEEDDAKEKSKDPSHEMREALARALKEEELRELKYKCERKAAAMGVLYYEDFETAEETHQRETAELAQSNRNYTGRRLPDRAPRRESVSEDDEPKEPKHPWDFKIGGGVKRQDEAPDEVQEHEFFNLLDEKERKRLLEKKLEKNMKKIQKQIAKEKQRVAEKKENAEKRKLVKTEVSENKIPKMEADDDEEDVDGVPLPDEPKGPDPATLAMRHPMIPGGLLEAEQRDQVTLALKIQPTKLIKRNTGKKTFIIKSKRR